MKPIVQISLDLTTIDEALETAALATMDLEHLGLERPAISDYGFLADMGFKSMALVDAPAVRSVAMLEELPLVHLTLLRTGVEDLTPLRDHRLESIHLDRRLLERHRVLLKAMKSLKRIAIDGEPSMPVLEFWQAHPAPAP